VRIDKSSDMKRGDRNCN